MLKTSGAKYIGLSCQPQLSDDLISTVFNNPNFTVFPGFCDVHVHFREPGFSYKETIYTGSRAAARGGYTDVCTMPNLNPVPDTPAHLKAQTDIIERDSVINIYPYGTITMHQAGEQLSDMQGMSKDVIAFSDDGRGVQSDSLMEQAMLEAKRLGKMIVAHCEVNSLLNGGYIHDGVYARAHGHRGICSASEYEQIARDIELVKKTGVSYHVCHISTKESVDIIRRAKREGVDITCETGPHYLVLDDSHLKEHGRFKMNPPLRGIEDRLALIEGVVDGTIDMIATDHAPHSAEEKALGLEKSPFGITGIETAFPVLYSGLVKTDIITLEKLVALLTVNPRKRFNIPMGDNYTVWDLEKTFTVDSKDFVSMGKATPFEGMTLQGECVMTVVNGKAVYTR